MTPEAARTIADYLIRGLEGEYQTTMKVIASLPDSRHGWRPHEKGRTAGQLAWHIVYCDIWLVEGVATGQFSSENEGDAPKTTAEILDHYKKHFPAALEKARQVSAEKLSTPLNFYNIYNLPGALYLGFANNHSIHHRGQLAAYLRAMGEKVPSIYGGSADEPFMAESAAT